jgi:hypothetical protein
MHIHTCMYVYILTELYTQIIYVYIHLHDDDDDDDDFYLRLQYGKRFHNLVYMSYVKHVNPASRLSN